MPLKLKGKMQYYQNIHISEMRNLVKKYQKYSLKIIFQTEQNCLTFKAVYTFEVSF